MRIGSKAGRRYLPWALQTRVPNVSSHEARVVRLTPADIPHSTTRVALYVCKQCRGASIREVADVWCLEWHGLKAMEMQCMHEQLARGCAPSPPVIGIDELSSWNGRVCRIIVSYSEQGRAIWFGGGDRSVASLTQW